MKAIDCGDCPLGWEDRSYESECYDCGCMRYGELYGDRLICRLPMRVKDFMANRINAKREKQEMELYDGMADYWAKEQRKETAMRRAINEALAASGMYVCFKSEEGRYYPIGADDAYGNGYFDASYGEPTDILDRYESSIREGGQGI